MAGVAQQLVQATEARYRDALDVITSLLDLSLLLLQALQLSNGSLPHLGYLCCLSLQYHAFAFTLCELCHVNHNATCQLGLMTAWALHDTMASVFMSYCPSSKQKEQARVDADKQHDTLYSTGWLVVACHVASGDYARKTGMCW